MWLHNLLSSYKKYVGLKLVSHERTWTITTSSLRVQNNMGNWKHGDTWEWRLPPGQQCNSFSFYHDNKYEFCCTLFFREICNKNYINFSGKNDLNLKNWIINPHRATHDSIVSECVQFKKKEWKFGMVDYKANKVNITIVILTYNSLIALIPLIHLPNFFHE